MSSFQVKKEKNKISDFNDYTVYICDRVSNKER